MTDDEHLRGCVPAPEVSREDSAFGGYATVYSWAGVASVTVDAGAPTWSVRVGATTVTGTGLDGRFWGCLSDAGIRG